MRTRIFVHMNTPDFRRVNAKLKVRVLRSSVLGPAKIWSTDRNLSCMRFVSHIAKILCQQKQIIVGKCGWMKLQYIHARALTF
jgi:hypothetical protein